MNKKLTKFSTHNSLITRLSAIVTECHLQNYNPSNYSGTHSLVAHLNCLRNFCSCAIGCILSRAGFANVHTARYRKFAFTLAETLIVMGIIGVVAALTLPNLNSSTGDKEKVAKVKKVYSNMNDAMGRAIAVYGPYNTWFTNDTTRAAQTTRFATRVGEFLKISKDCGISGTGCIGNTYKTIKRDHTENVTGSNYYTVVLADGTGVSFTALGNYIYFDIDGINKGPSISGKDLFRLNVNATTGEVTPAGAADSSSYLLTCDCLDNGFTDCTAWVVMHDNMDYLKTNSSGQCTNNTSIKLDGTTNTSCK